MQMYGKGLLVKNGKVGGELEKISAMVYNLLHFWNPAEFY